MTRRRILTAVACLALAATVTLRLARRPSRPNILLVTMDTLRADHCSAYGYRRPTTPTLDRLAQEGVLFEAAYAPMATTGPSHASMFTGLPPRSHGLIKNGHLLRPDLTTLAESLLVQGYQTAAFVSSYVLNHGFGFNQGFATYDDDFAEGKPSGRTVLWEGRAVPEEFDRRADQTRARVVKWLADAGHLSARRNATPFFVWVHLFDPHSPYHPPTEHRLFSGGQAGDALEATKAAYDGEVHFADAELGKLVDALREAGRLDDTLVIVVGDHGEGLMDHGHMEHGIHLYEEAVRVPLVIRWPGHVPPHRVREPVAIVDLAPSLISLAGSGASSGIAGQPGLLPQLRGGAGDPDIPIFLERRQYETNLVGSFALKGVKRALRRGRFKYIEAPDEGTFELYDLVADPWEKRNLRSEQPQLASELAALLQAWAQRTPAAPAPQLLSDEATERLRSLGYVK